MITRLDSATRTFLTDLRGINEWVDQAQREVSSGRKVNRISDDPGNISTIMQIRSELAQTQQITENLSRLKTDVDAAEQALQQAVEILERAAVLGMQGASSIMSPEERGIVAGEVEGLLEQMVGVSRTTVNAQFIFSGNAGNIEPFTFDLTQTDPVGPYQGADATRQAMHPTGSLFSTSLTAEEIFDNADPDKNAFDTINELRVALRNNDEDAIGAALNRIATVETHLNTELAFYGTVQNKVQEASDFSHDQELRLRTNLSTLVDADITESILNLNQAAYQREIALTTRAKAPSLSLFDFLG